MTTVIIEDADDTRAAVQRALTDMGMTRSVKPGDRVFFKPNLTYPSHRPGVTTSPHFIRAVLETFADLGAKLTVGEGDGGYGAYPADVAFEGHGLREICQTFAADLVNLSLAPARQEELLVRDEPYPLALPVVLLDETDLFVTLPVPKIHAMTHYSGAVKNQWGCIPDAMRLKRHPDFTDLIWAVNERLRTGLVIGDARYVLDRNGPMSGEPVYMNRVVVADDILACDVTVTEQLMGLRPDDMAYLQAGKRYGFRWTPDTVDDRSTGPDHQFVLHRTLRNRLALAAFPRQWAVNLLWCSPVGDLVHRLFYSIRGNPVVRERIRVEEIARRRRLRLQSRELPTK